MSWQKAIIALRTLKLLRDFSSDCPSKWSKAALTITGNIVCAIIPLSLLQIPGRSAGVARTFGVGEAGGSIPLVPTS